MRTGGRFSRLICSALILGLLQICSAHNNGCKISQLDGRIKVEITDEQRVPDELTSTCRYSWSNSRGVIATNNDSSPEVLAHTINSVETSECFEETVREAHCGKLYRVVCKANCSANAQQSKDKDKETETRHHWTVLVVFLLLLLLLLVIYLCYRKAKTSCCQLV